MTIITFGEEDAKALSWVASGAENSDPGAVLIIDVDGTGSTARVSTNTAALIRSMVISVDDAQDESIALRAKTLASIASKVEEGVNLTLTTNGDKVSVACGATSLNLTNLYDHVMDVTRRLHRDRVATVTTEKFIESMVNAGAASSKEEVILDFEDDLVTVGARNDRIHTQELYPASVYDTPPPLRIIGGHLKVMKPLAKLEFVGALDIFVGTGYVIFRAPVDDPESHIRDISMVVPTVVSGSALDSSPCDEDVTPSLSVSRSLLRGALAPLSGAVESYSVVTMTFDADGQLVVSVASNEGTGKTTILDAKVNTPGTIEVLLGDLTTALRSITDSEVNIGETAIEDDTWVTVTPVDEDDDSEDDDTMYSGGDIIVAIRSQS